jgi:hypothetical protein
LFVGSVGGPPLSTTSSTGVVDLTRTMTAGFRIADGTPVWTDAGTIYMCSILPCPGAAQTSSGTSTYTPPTLGLRLRMTGTATYDQSGAVTAVPSATVIIEGFNLATGRTVWSFNAGHDTSLIQQSIPPQIAPDTLIVPNPAGTPTELDLASGASTPTPPATVGWCDSLTMYHMNVPFPTADGGQISDYTGDLATVPCDPSGHQVATPTTVPSFAGPTIGNLVAWSEPGAVIARART